MDAGLLPDCSRLHVIDFQPINPHGQRTEPSHVVNTWLGDLLPGPEDVAYPDVTQPDPMVSRNGTENARQRSKGASADTSRFDRLYPHQSENCDGVSQVK